MVAELPIDHEVRVARANRALLGLAIGDAFGERFFGPPERARARIAARALPPPPWRTTDDTAMALSVVESLRELGRIEPDLLATRFARRWAAEPDRGYGAGAHALLRAIALGGDWRVASRALFGSGSYGNGGAMRVAPIGGYFADDADETILREARASAEVTHAHPEGQAGAIAVALGAAHAARHGAAGASGLIDFVLARTPPGETRDAIAVAAALPMDAPVGRAAELLGTGGNVSAMDTVPFTLWCAARHLGAYDEALWSTVSGLGDRDTTCAIVGGIVALASPGTIPAAWRDATEPLPP